MIPQRLQRGIARLWEQDAPSALTQFEGMTTEDLMFCVGLARQLQVGVMFVVAKRMKAESGNDASQDREAREPDSPDDAESSVG